MTEGMTALLWPDHRRPLPIPLGRSRPCDQPSRFWFLIERGPVVYPLHRRLGPVTQPALHALKSWSRHAVARLQWPSTLGYVKPVSKEKPSEGLKLVETRVQQLRLLDPLVHHLGSETSKTANRQRKLIQRQPSLGECILNTAHMGPVVTLAPPTGQGPPSQSRGTRQHPASDLTAPLVGTTDQHQAPHAPETSRRMPTVQATAAAPRGLDSWAGSHGHEPRCRQKPTDGNRSSHRRSGPQAAPAALPVHRGVPRAC